MRKSAGKPTLQERLVNDGERPLGRKRDTSYEKWKDVDDKKATKHGLPVDLPCDYYYLDAKQIADYIASRASGGVRGFSTEINLDPMAIWGWLHGRSSMNLETYCRILVTLDLPLGTFLRKS